MKTIALLLTVLLCLGCTKNEDANSEVEVIRAQLMEIAEMSALDRPAAEMTSDYMMYFAADSTLIPANGEAIHGLDAIAGFYNNAFDGIKILSNKYENPVIVVNGPMATSRYLGTAVFSVIGQEETLTAKNRYIDVLVKENGQWKMLWHSWVPVTAHRGEMFVRYRERQTSGLAPCAA